MNQMKAIWDKHEKRELDAAERTAAESAREEQHSDDANEKRGDLPKLEARQ